MNEAEFEQQRLRRFEETNLCNDLMPPDRHRHLETLFDRRWAKRIEACPDYIEVAAQAWIITSTNWEYYPEWKRFFSRHREEVRRIWMSEEDLSVFRTFPKPFRLYRGYNKPLGKMGFSWSLERRIAAKISYGRVNDEWIITAMANPEDVIAYTDRRLEREVIIDPKNILEVLKEEPMKMEDLAEPQNMESKPKTPQAGDNLIGSSLLNNLKCKQIVNLPNQRAALITGGVFKAGERKEVTIEGHEVEIHCLEIRDESVLIKIDGVEEPQELSLPSSQKRWKSYLG
jgi:hypothetical protein